MEHDNLRYRGHHANVGSNKNPEIHPGKEGSGGNYCLKCGAWKGQLGLEPTPELYIEHMTEIFHEVKRVLKKEGTFWLNIGDTYSHSSGHFDAKNPKARQQRLVNNPANLQLKCLCMIPERLAWSLIQDGWILRNKICWHKPNSMPSSVKDRFSNTWEYVYLFAKSKQYYFDLDAVRENLKHPNATGTYGTKHIHKQNPQFSHSGNYYNAQNYLGKNPGDHWSINTHPFPAAHFAVFPEKLCEKPIKAGCPEEVCKKCGKARERIIEEKRGEAINSLSITTRQGNPHKGGNIYRPIVETRTIGWTSCGCNAGFEGGILLDPFCGAGTALYVAKQLRRRYIGIDIKQEYVDMAKKRLAQGVL